MATQTPTKPKKPVLSQLCGSSGLPQMGWQGFWAFGRADFPSTACLGLGWALYPPRHGLSGGITDFNHCALGLSAASIQRQSAFWRLNCARSL